jgi:ribose 5-phosphate isomerase RpiB
MSGALDWPERVLTARDLERHLNGHGELTVRPDAVVTPLAEERLRLDGVRLVRRPATNPDPAARLWLVCQERPFPLVESAVKALARDGLRLSDAGGGCGAVWFREVAACVARGDCEGGVVFCGDPALACCVANKVPGVRAAAAATVAQAARAWRVLAANLIAVEMPGRTFFEVRQILRTLGRSARSVCGGETGATLRELDGFPHDERAG